MLREHLHQSHIENYALHQHPHERHHEEIVQEHCHNLAANLAREEREGGEGGRRGREEREGGEGGRERRWEGGREREKVGGRERRWEGGREGGRREGVRRVEGGSKEGGKGMERYTIATDIHLRGTHHTSPWLHSGNEGQLCSHETDA